MRRLPEMGFDGIEIAPSRVWKDTWHGLRPADVEAYRKTVDAAGLSVIGLHSLFFDHPELGMFRGADIREQTLNFLVHLSGLCRDLGGRTLIYGSKTARPRGALSLDEAHEEAVDFMGELCLRIKEHGTCFCFEPLEIDVADFINSAHESLAIVKAVNDPGIGVQLDAKALVANNEASPDIFAATRDYLVHFHANEPGLGVLGTSGDVDHAQLGRYLRDVGYDGYVSNEQIMAGDDALASLARSAEVLRQCYG
ncbi:MAG: sugar phosphate isomerase/epimerase [Rhodospirillales bacterium]|nr:sugar phosphate isomerase/epimerase [Rhodospirillales bacterium]